VFMIKCDKVHLSTLTRMFCAVDENYIKFFPWNSYVIQQAGQKLTIINRQLQYTNNFRSLLLTGFEDHQDNIPMKIINPDDMEIKPKDEELNDVLVMDYLWYYVHSSQGANLFEYVFPPYSGNTREFIVKVAFVAEAASYLENGKGELARNMTIDSIMEVFTDPEEAQEEATYPAWKPFLQATNIPVTAIKHYSLDNKNKRTRYNMSDKRSNIQITQNDTQHTSTNYNQMPNASNRMKSYSSIVQYKDNEENHYSSIPIQNTINTIPTVHNTSPISPHGKSITFQPLAGLGGGIDTTETEQSTRVTNINTATEMQTQINRMEDDILQLKRSIASSNKSVKKLEETITTDIQKIDKKLNNTAKRIMGTSQRKDRQQQCITTKPS
jgi:hypothetical protein